MFFFFLSWHKVKSSTEGQRLIYSCDKRKRSTAKAEGCGVGWGGAGRGGGASAAGQDFLGKKACSQSFYEFEMW